MVNKSLDDEHRANLEKLATYLESLPEDYSHFDMSDYARHSGECPFKVERAIVRGEDYLSNCGTVACAVGHGPAAGIPFTEYEMWESCGDYLVDWSDYSKRVFGCSTFSRYNLFDFMFGSSWDDIDNTPRGAAARIRYILDGNDPQPVSDLSRACYSKYERESS